MPFNLPVANKGAGAQEIDDGLAIGRFDDLVLREHPDWAGTDKFGKEDDGSRFHFCFTLVDEKGAVLYDEAGDPLEVEATTRTATGEKSNFAKHMRGLMKPTEFAAWQAASDEFDGSFLAGRFVNLQISHNSKGWPQVETVIGVAKIAGQK